MRNLVYSMTVSLDGFIAGPSGEIDWSAPDEELHRFHNERMRETGVELCGRGLYEVMTYWDTPEAFSSGPDYEREFAQLWKDTPKIVFSRTLEEVQGNATLATGSVAEVVTELKQQPGKDLAVGGATLAAACMEHGLIDEFQLFVAPVVLGGGTPYFPAMEQRIHLELVEVRTFGSIVVYQRYRRREAGV
jgi:dihydrofolate reductase